MTKRVLIIVHQEHSTPGKVGELLQQRSCKLDRRCPNIGEPLPQCLDGYAAAVIFGGPMSANDEHLPGIRAELDWLDGALAADTPLLGICLGAQLMARALGAKVSCHPEGLVEIGYHEVRPTAQGDGFLERPIRFYQWHRETFELPRGAVHLAENQAFPQQAFRYDGHAFGVEFHPEMTRAIVDRWTASEKGEPQLSLPGAQPREHQLTGFDRYAAASDCWLGTFLDRYLLRTVPANFKKRSA